MRVREDEQCPMIIVGNKCDLGDLREVQETEAKEWAKSINALQIESSAKSSINIGQIFTDVTREVIRLSNQPKASAAAADTSDKAGGCCLIM
jgi:GTPase SAR1 family protein